MKSGLYGWLNKNMTHMKGRKGQQGFTLIELLVVVTILGVLAAIVTLSLVGLTSNANTQSCNSEYKTVQAAIDAYMANNQLSQLPGAQVALTNDMSNSTLTQPGNLKNGTLPLYVATLTAAQPYNYTRNGTTQFYYAWDVFGKVNAISSTSGTAPGTAVTGCAVK
jgi:prepilin-type N-terminal cleavage/methylation domain-containing protein